MTTDLFYDNLKTFKEDLRQRRTVMRAFPIWLGLVLTTRCNLRCVMCGRVWKKGDLPPAVAAKVRPLYPYLSRIEWQGGEVFVVDYFRDMFEEASRHPHINHLITTAGPLIDAKWAQSLSRPNVVLMFSVDTGVPEHYRRIRKGAELDDVLRAFRRLDEAEKSLGRGAVRSLNATIMRENAGDVPSLIPFAQKHRFVSLDISPRVPLDDGASLFDPRGLDKNRPELLRLRSGLLAAREDARRAGIRLLDRVLPIVESLLGTDEKGPAPRDPAAGGGPSREAWDCYIPWRGLFIQAEYNDGDIMPDCQCYTTAVGNINRDDLVDVWNNGAMQEYRRRILEKKPAGWCNAECTFPGVNPVEWSKPNLDYLLDRAATVRRSQTA